MNSGTLPPRIRKVYKTLHFYTIKLPFIYIMIPIGFIFEYLITWPFILLVLLDRGSSGRSRRNR